MQTGLLDDSTFDQLAGNVQGAESSNDPTAVSPAGAQGLMQLMPGTGRDMAAEVGEVYNPLDAKQNVRLGRRYLRHMLDKYRDIPTALAAYNWGPGHVDKWLARGGDWNELPAETQAYIERVTHGAARGAGTAARGGSESDRLNRAQLPPNAYDIAKAAIGDWRPPGALHPQAYNIARAALGASAPPAPGEVGPRAYNVALAALRAGTGPSQSELPPAITESDKLNLAQLQPRAA